MRRLTDRYRTGGGHSLSLFGAADFVSQRIELSFQTGELSQLLSRQGFTARLKPGQSLKRLIEFGAFATQLKYKGHGASWA